MQWYRMDLHIHTPASKDYQQPGVTYLDVLHQAERRGLSIIAFTDHNTVRGYREMVEEVERLTWLESASRITPEEYFTLQEYQRLFRQMLILPGFEFTATFGFHILGVFPPDFDVRRLEYLLLDLNIPAELLDVGETNVGASADVLAAYSAIHEAGGIAIAAHVNSAHGVAMRGLNFGGQTRIAYTQDPHLMALEVTDLENKSRQATARFFDGSKPEYPRPMRCIQGSDAHRLDKDARTPKNLGVGERATEILLPELSYKAIYDVFTSSDLGRTRAAKGVAPMPVVDPVAQARQLGETETQCFIEQVPRRGNERFEAVLIEICALANGAGGTIFIGVSADERKKMAGIKNAPQVAEALTNELVSKLVPAPSTNVDVLPTPSGNVVRVQVLPGREKPYAIDGQRIYVRRGSETRMAVRDDIVQMVVAGTERAPQPQMPAPSMPEISAPSAPAPRHENGTGVLPPRTGVEIVATEKRNDTIFHHVRDLRNDSVVHNVTRHSARKLWHYAIIEVEEKRVNLDEVQWSGSIGLIKQYTRAGRMRYDLAQRDNGRVRVYFSVTEDGMRDAGHQPWRALLQISEDK